MTQPQMFIPLFAEGTVAINKDLAYTKDDGKLCYFNGHSMPVFSHAEEDVKSFKMIVSQFCVSGISTQAEFDKDPLLHKFILIFDREGYSPEFILKMKNKNIACLTYNKYPKDDWVKEEFSMHKVKLHSGELVEMQLAERGVFLGKKVWVREVRRLMDGGHQTSIISTAYRLDLIDQAAGMFARWSQENFFK